MHRVMVGGTFLALILVMIGGFVLLRTRSGPSTVPSMASVIPAEITEETSPTPTATMTVTETSTSTSTATVTPTATSTATPTATQTLSTLVVRLNVVNPDVTLVAPVGLQPTFTATPLPTLPVPTPEARIQPHPGGDTPLIGWFQREVTDTTIQREGKWDSFTATYRSANKRYLYSDDDRARLRLRFLGAGVRVRYVAYFSYGVFQVLVDGQVRATVDSYYPRQADGRGNFLTTEVFALAHGWHTLEIVRMGRQAPESSGTVIAIDAIDLYLYGPEPTALPTFPTVPPTFTPSPRPASKIEVIAAPPPVLPTATEKPPTVVSVNLTVAYDTNNNRAIEPGKGVQGLSVRLMTADTNQVVASGLTGADGFLRLEATSSAPLRLVIPFLNRYYEVPAGSVNYRITLLIPGANQPGLIP